MAAHTNDPTENAYSSAWPAISTKTCTVAGIITNIFGVSELPPDCTDVACIWLLHPRLQRQACMKPIAALSIADWNKRRGNSTKGLIAVSFDQRNHGSRGVDEKANKAWREGNETHAQDMFSIYRGTALDTSLLLDHIASYAFPDRPIPISQNIVLGISLGGHAAWHCIFHDVRFNTAIIVIGCPDYLSLMSDRARLTKLSSYTSSDPPGASFAGSKDFPPDLVNAVKKYDPAGLLLSGDKSEISKMQDRDARMNLQHLLNGKRILNMSGGADKLVPYRCGETFIKWFKKAIATSESYEEGFVHFDDRVYDGVGHQFTPVMLEEAVAFIGDSVGRSGGGKTDTRQSKI